jgi:hypothetical protein
MVILALVACSVRNEVMLQINIPTQGVLELHWEILGDDYYWGGGICIAIQNLSFG